MKISNNWVSIDNFLKKTYSKIKESPYKTCIKLRKCDQLPGNFDQKSWPHSNVLHPSRNTLRCFLDKMGYGRRFRSLLPDGEFDLTGTFGRDRNTQTRVKVYFRIHLRIRDSKNTDIYRYRYYRKKSHYRYTVFVYERLRFRKNDNV